MLISNFHQSKAQNALAYWFMIHSTIVEQMKQERGITEQLKADDWWRWVQEVGNIRNAAEEFVLREIVYG